MLIAVSLRAIFDYFSRFRWYAYFRWYAIIYAAAAAMMILLMPCDADISWAANIIDILRRMPWYAPSWCLCYAWYVDKSADTICRHIFLAPYARCAFHYAERRHFEDISCRHLWCFDSHADVFSDDALPSFLRASLDMFLDATPLAAVLIFTLLPLRCLDCRHTPIIAFMPLTRAFDTRYGLL